MTDTTTAQEIPPMAKRGRPRNPGPREPSGRPQRHGPDRGTKAIQRLRQWYAGDADPALAAYPLGILLANSAITEEQHSAGCNYAWLHTVVFGRHSLAAVSWDRMDRGRDVERDSEDEERDLERIHEALSGHPRRCRAGLDNIAVFERLPRWMRPVDPRHGDVADAEYFKIGLAVLSKHRT